MSGARALWFLEWRQIVNRFRQMLRSPGRAAFYLLFVAYFVFVAFVRGVRARHGIQLSEPYSSAAFFAFITLLAVVAYGAASGYAGAFSSAADARFLTASAIDERMVVLWLQMRRSASAMGRTILSLLLFLIFVSREASSFGLALTVLGGTSCAAVVAVPVLALRRAIGKRLTLALCGAACAIGMLPLLIVLSSIFLPSITAAGIVRWHCGTAVNLLLHGNPAALAALWVFFLALVAAAWCTGRDLYPELYAASQRTMQFQGRRLRGAGALFSREQRYVGRDAGGAFRMLRGSWAIVWKEWIAFVRSPGLQRLTLLGAAASAIAGAALASLALRSAHPQREALAMLAPAFTTVLLTIAMGSAVTLSVDLRKPLWWMGSDALWLRLFAWACATSWRAGALIYIGLFAWAATIGMPVAMLLGIPLSIVSVIYLRSIGLFIYSLSPSTVDQRGPLAFVRTLLTYILSVPPILCAALTYFLVIHNVVAATGAALICALAEALLLVFVAALRIVGSGAAFTAAEYS